MRSTHDVSLKKRPKSFVNGPFECLFCQTAVSVGQKEAFQVLSFKSLTLNPCLAFASDCF